MYKPVQKRSNFKHRKEVICMKMVAVTTPNFIEFFQKLKHWVNTMNKEKG